MQQGQITNQMARGSISTKGIGLPTQGVVEHVETWLSHVGITSCQPIYFGFNTLNKFQTQSQLIQKELEETYFSATPPVSYSAIPMKKS